MGKLITKDNFRDVIDGYKAILDEQESISAKRLKELKVVSEYFLKGIRSPE